LVVVSPGIKCFQANAQRLNMKVSVFAVGTWRCECWIL